MARSAKGSMPPRAAAMSLATLVTSRRAGLYRLGPFICISAMSGGSARLDGGHELRLSVTKRRPVGLDGDLAVLGPVLHLLLEDVVAGGDEALEEPHAKLGRALRGGHALQHRESRGGATGDDRG